MQVKRTQSFTIVRGGKTPMNRERLDRCLLRLGVVPPMTRNHSGESVRIFMPYHKRKDPWYLYDMVMKGKEIYHSLIVNLHPDKGGDLEQCLQLNELWARIKELALRKGIEI